MENATFNLHTPDGTCIVSIGASFAEWTRLANAFENSPNPQSIEGLDQVQICFVPNVLKQIVYVATEHGEFVYDGSHGQLGELIKTLIDMKPIPSLSVTLFPTNEYHAEHQ